MQSTAVRGAARAPTTTPTTTATATTTSSSTSRRALLLSALAGALAPVRGARAAGAITPPEDVSSSELVQRLLARTNAPGARERRKKERLDAFNDKIFGEGYFEVEVGQGAARARGISDDTAGKIAAWQKARDARVKQQ